MRGHLEAEHDGERRVGQGLAYGPVEHDRDCGTCLVRAWLARGPLRPLLRMRLRARSSGWFGFTLAM